MGVATNPKEVDTGIFLQGSMEECRNYRTVFEHSWLGLWEGKYRQLKVITKSRTGQKQKPFLKGTGCVDQAFTGMTMAEDHTFTALMCLEKAYGKVGRRAM